MTRRPRRVVHLSTTHSPLDVRIFEKQCRSLAAAGYDVHLVVPGAPDGERRDGVTFHAIEKPLTGFRLLRILRRLANAYRAARALDADLYHFHDCELIPTGCALKLSGARVVYDVHEHFPLEAFSINKDRPARAITLSLAWRILEAAARRVLDGFIGATPVIAARFPKARTVLVQNYPRLADFPPPPPSGSDEARVVYAGGISPIRGIREIVLSLGLLPPDSPIRLALLGSFSEPAFEAELRALPGWARVDYIGFAPRQQMVAELARCRAGLVLFHPERDHVDAQPNKLFEYMAAGLAVIASDFPLWKSLVEGSGSGICVDPLDPRAIARAIERIALDPALAARLGGSGRAAVEQRVNWDREAAVLLAFYARLLGTDARDSAVPRPEASPAAPR
jgi:glycosyltransferase involved in cell wall biosynthesis